MNETVGRTYYNSSYRHGVDEKRRIQIPAKWRSADAGTELTLVLWQKQKDVPWLRVLPPEKMASMVRDIEALPNADPNKATLKRLIGSKSVQVSLDSAGRICLPEAMAKEAGIDKEVILVGVLDAYEIWSPERYAKVSQADESMASEAFKYME
jgi:MraZ protein